MESFSVPALAEIPASASLADIVVARAERRPDEVMLRRRTGPGQWQDVTAAAFRAEVEALAAGLVAAGLEPGDRVGLMSATRYEWTVIDYAIWTAGGVTVPVYETSSSEQVEWYLGDSGARGVFAESDADAATIGAAAAQLPGLDLGVWKLDELGKLSAQATGGDPAGAVAGPRGQLAELVELPDAEVQAGQPVRGGADRGRVGV